MNTNFENYKTFYFVAKYGNITAAAEALYSEQPNVTRAIKNLERDLGCVLFTRSNKGVTLTPEGEKLYRRVSIAYEQIAAAEEELSRYNGFEEGILRIGVSETALHEVLLSALCKFHSLYPKIKFNLINLTNAQAIGAVKNQAVDFVLIATPFDLDKSLKSVPIKKFQDIVVCGERYKYLTGEIVDITGKGVDDIKNHIIRTPNDPDTIFDDDPLRILRCIRFASRYGWEIEYDTYEGMVRNVSRLKIITKERVKDEFCKMLTCKHPIMAMELLRKIGAMHYVIPELEETYSMTQNEYHFGTVWEHTMMVLEGIKDDNMILRISALLHDIGKIRVCTEEDGKIHFLKHELKSGEMIDELLRPLKFSNEIIKEVTFSTDNNSSSIYFLYSRTYSCGNPPIPIANENA